MKLQEGLAWKKTPLDVTIVVWLAIISALMHFLVFILILLGLAHSPPGYQHRVLFGWLHLVSDVAVGTYSFLMAMACLGCAFGLWKCYRVGWWFTLSFSFYNIADALFGIFDFPVSTSVAIFFSLIIITWLILRRKLYHVGETRKKEADSSQHNHPVLL